MSESPPPPSPKKEVLAPPQESLRADFTEAPVAAELAYGEARLWVIARDPHCLFAYWEFRPSEHPDAVGADGRSRFFLRIFCDGRAESTTDIEDGAGKAFVHAGAADAGYHAELGFFAKDVWCFLARSKNTRTPPELPATVAPAVFATVPAAVSLGKLREVLSDSALPGESVASTAARIQGDARTSAARRPEDERLLAEILGESAGPDVASPASSATLARRIRRKLDAAAEVAAPGPPIPVPPAGSAPSSASASWPTSPGTAMD